MWRFCRSYMQVLEVADQYWTFSMSDKAQLVSYHDGPGEFVKSDISIDLWWYRPETGTCCVWLIKHLHLRVYKQQYITKLGLPTFRVYVFCSHAYTLCMSTYIFCTSTKKCCVDVSSTLILFSVFETIQCSFLAIFFTVKHVCYDHLNNKCCGFELWKRRTTTCLDEETFNRLKTSPETYRYTLKTFIIQDKKITNTRHKSINTTILHNPIYKTSTYSKMI